MPDRDVQLEAALSARLTGSCFGGALEAYRVCDSTMERAHAAAHEGAGEGMLVFALRQERGRGRLGRRWESPEGGAYFSLILRPSRPVADIPQLSLVAGLATAEAVRELTGLSASIKWPNDLQLDGKKLAGILIETREVSGFGFRVSGAKYVVVGIGINVTTDPKKLPETATSLAAHGVSCDVTAPVAAICRHFDRWYDVWTTDGFSPIRQALQPWLALGQLVRLTVGASKTEGQATDLDEAGRLLVRLDAGLVRAFDVGDVSFLREEGP